MTPAAPMTPTEVGQVFRAEAGRAVASLVRVVGDIDIAEDAVQEAFEIAVRRWPESGIPPSPAGWIITPHPGEAARLLGADTAAVQAHRLGAARELHARYGAVTVLKGAGTLVAWGDAGAMELAICERGNPGMATAGMGDVLTGVIAGLRAQGSDSAQAARIGVLVHALAGDSAAQGGQRGLLASDVIAELRGWVNP